MNCKFCERECKSANSLRNHERLCKENPDRDVPNMMAARLKSARPVPCQYCQKEVAYSNLKKHERTCLASPTVKAKRAKNCPVCGIEFYTRSATCSYTCSNRHFRTGTDNGNWKGTRYQTVCFDQHKKECVVCGESKIVAVHHFNCDHNDNSIENLVPLCPTHHQYMHSRFKDEILATVEKYINKFKQRNVG